MSLVRTLRILASQRPSTPSRAVADPGRVQRLRHGRVPVTWIDQHLAGTAAIVHLHGGAYVAGESPQTWSWLEEVARRSGAAAAMVHYRLAPRHRYPAAVEDVLHVLEDLSTRAVLRSGRWLLSGDSAGGGLALAVAQTLSASGVDSPSAVLLESPWADLDDDAHGREDLRIAARLYAGAVPRTEPRISPLHGELAGLPPVHLVSGARDELVGDSRRLDAALSAAEVPHEYLEIPGVGHQVAIAEDGPASQQARRFQIAAVRSAVGADGGAEVAAH
ncbi:alpha/beta hydrolase fold domain-containing protein [Brachybacterium sp. AOP43-C2-M15]|uniref:alpha/beta hydrolase fold domain-containing protein n=1 Tax=Brachybacterium sp. AOP43-C2-M15 TaxID=3457661 RepID=UPI0040335FE9